MQNIEKIKTSGTTYAVRDANTLLNLNATTTEEVTAFGTYNGNEVANNTVFTSDEGKFQEFTKVQETGETSFTEFGTFPQSQVFAANKIIKNGSPLYMAVGDANKCYTSTDGLSWAQKGYLTADCSANQPVYKNGVWFVRGTYSEDDGATWGSATAGISYSDWGVAGDYFYTKFTDGYTLSTNGKDFTSHSFSGFNALIYDGTDYVLLANYVIYKTKTPEDETSWEEYASLPQHIYAKGLSYNNGKYYLSYRSAGDWKTYFYVSSDLNNWTAFSQAFGGNRDTYTSISFVGDLVILIVFPTNYSTSTMYQSADFGQTFTELTNSNPRTKVVGNELWYITGGKTYSLNPNPHWVYTLTDIGGGGSGSDVALTDIATAGTGIKFAGASDQNFTINGSPTITGGIYSNIDNGNNIVADYKFQPSTNTWEYLTKVTIGSDTSSGSFFFGRAGNGDKYPQIGIEGGKFYMAASYSGSSWDINTHGSSVTQNTTYWIKVSYDGSYYKIQYKTNEEDEWSDGLSVTSSSSLYVPDVKMAIGWYYSADYYFRGSIDLNETSMKVNDVVVWAPYTTLDKPAITVDIGSGASAPQQSTEGYIGKLYVTDGGAVYICTGVSGSTYTWSQITVS